MDCSLHFRTPTSLLRGKDFSGFFRPITESHVNSFLSTLGCVCEERKTRCRRVSRGEKEERGEKQGGGRGEQGRGGGRRKRGEVERGGERWREEGREESG